VTKRYRSRDEKRQFYKQLFLILLGFAAVFLVAGLVYKIVDQQLIRQEEEEKKSGVVEFNGVKYIPKKNIKTYLFMGIDTTGKVKKVTSYDESAGQSDVLIVMVRDVSNGTYKTLPINRNTITEIENYDLDGSFIATSESQICLAHAHGDGMEVSCKATVNAVSDLLLGQKIDGYMSLNMGAIGTINHEVGGVTVTIEDDFSQSDTSLKMGETVKLSDEQAIRFVHDRMNVADGTNENRMKRQSVYLNALKPVMKEKCAEDQQFPIKLYESLQDYMVTNIQAKTFSKLALMAMQDKDEGEVTIEGTNSIGDNDLYEFRVDEDSLTDAVIELFYDKYE
jgi:anionic cell wall polymer biosynthesis LytR-Cps2A-Psr (LCP) family protein